MNPHPHERGDVESGKQVFRFETFGNEGFWTDAARLPQGIMQAKLTPKQALEAGLQVDVEAIERDARSTRAGTQNRHVSAERADAA